MKAPLFSISACALVAGTVLLIGCAQEVPRRPAQFASIDSTVGLMPVEVAEDVGFELDTGYQRRIVRGSKWAMTGRITQGDVYKPLRQVFTVQGSHQHEAYLVLNNGLLVGFYVPFDQSFVPQRTKVVIKFTY